METIFAKLLAYAGFFLVGVSSSYASLAAADLPPPYANIELLPFDNFGWYANASQMEHLIATNPVNTVVEVGCYIGSSTRHIASLLPSGGKLFAVDHWLGSIEQQSGHFCHTPIEQLYQQFLSNVIHAKLTDKIIPIRMESSQAAQYLSNVSVDLVYIDASHDTESVYRDLTAWYPFVKGHGILCGDDWHYPPIVEALTKFAQENDLIIESNQDLWRLIEKKI